jgi:hypothetical protein
LCLTHLFTLTRWFTFYYTSLGHCERNEVYEKQSTGLSIL